MFKKTISTVLAVVGITAACSETTGPMFDDSPSLDRVPSHLRWANDGTAKRFTSTTATGLADGSGLYSANVFAPLFLQGDGTPVASLTHTVPSAGALPNHDSNRDDFPGLLLSKDGAGVIQQTDHTKYQMWVGPSGPTQINSPVSLVLWTAAKDFNSGKREIVEAGLFECDSDGSDCSLITQTESDISSSNTWTERTIDFGTVIETIPSGRALAVKVTVGDDSDDDMWLAYDAAGYPSRLTHGGTELEAYQVSFWAVHDEDREIQIDYLDATNGASNPFLHFRVPAYALATRPDGSAITAGDSILISVTVDPVEILVDMQPSGLQFSQAAPAELQMWYDGAGEDLNGDGGVNSVDANIEQNLLEMWVQHDNNPWEIIDSNQSTATKSFTAFLEHFSNYAVAW